MAIQLLGASDARLDFGDIADNLTAITVAITFKPSNISNDERIISKWAPDPNASWLITVSGDDEILFVVAGASYPNWCGKTTTGANLAAGNTYRIVCRWSNASWQDLDIWVNGVQQATSVTFSEYPTSIRNTGTAVQVGHETASAVDGCDGDYSEIAIFGVKMPDAFCEEYGKGFGPGPWRRNGLLYVPAYRSDYLVDEWGGNAVTNSSGTTAPHPSVIEADDDDIIQVPAAGGGEGQVVEVGLVSETDTALGVTALKRKAVGLAAETDAALGLSAAKRKAAGLATEADTAFAVAALKRRTAGLAIEFDSALAVAGASKAKEIGLATETDTALQAVVVASGQIIPVGLAEETDTALGLTAAKKKAIGLATETDSALAVAAAKRKAAGLAAETDSALALGTTTKVKEIGLAIELDRALAATVVGGVEPEPEEEVGRSRSGMIVTPGRLMNP